MGITTSQQEEIKQRIKHASRPLVFFDDDADGLCSYLLTKQLNNQAIALRAAMGPELKEQFLGYVHEHQPDLIIILDKPRVDETFITQANTPIIWIDHHDIHDQKPHTWTYQHLTYYNPQLQDETDSRPVSYWMYQITNGSFWLAAAGVLSDWSDELLQETAQKYPTLVNKHATIQEALFASKLGELIRILNFTLKGRTRTINKNISLLEQIQNPQELLEQTTSAATTIHQHVQPLQEQYAQQLAQALQTQPTNGVYVHVYSHLKQSFVTNIANELLYRIDAQVLIVARTDKRRVNASIRSHDINLPPVLEYALSFVDGYGGGHDNACGASISYDDWERFLEYFTEQLKL